LYVFRCLLSTGAADETNRQVWCATSPASKAFARTCWWATAWWWAARHRRPPADHLHRADAGQRHAEDGRADHSQHGRGQERCGCLHHCVAAAIFARPGSKLDVTVSSIGDAQSLEGGVLLMSALHGPGRAGLRRGAGAAGDGRILRRHRRNRKEVNAANVGLIPQGAMVERDTSVDLSGFKTVSLLLRNPDFTTATDIADAV
jgi:hypothetical protein